MKIITALAIALLNPLTAAHAAEPIAAFAPGARILFQGDSITDGNRGRSADPNHILGHGYAFIIAAKYGASFAPLKLDFINRIGMTTHLAQTRSNGLLSMVKQMKNFALAFKLKNAASA